MKSLDEINYIMSKLDTDTYESTKQAVEEYLKYGNRGFLQTVSRTVGLKEEDILKWWA